ncbi:glycosyltransferase family 2 protein (plasmid) [Mesorhizobium sp. AaZ16]|uniref:glycosyltransferase family 2 protein n=1 Tax=Mesorhizobium sp. AaZ16 TaxID=3402289 RepID=UPI00374ED004
MTVSVIIPLFNKAPYLTRALNSIWAQDFDDFEVIVVDDGSSDDGLSVARSHKDKRLCVLSQANAGPGAARNRGLAQARLPSWHSWTRTTSGCRIFCLLARGTSRRRDPILPV